MVVKVKKVFSIIVLIVLSTMLASCNYLGFFKNDSINTDTLNHISTVVINSNLKVKTETYQVIGVPGPYQGSGSGVIIKKDKEGYYYILTNSHVIHFSDKFNHVYTVEDIYNNSSSATLVAKSSVYDLAILKFQSTIDMEVMSLAQTNPSVGELVFSIGSPSGKHNIITAGNIIDFQNIDNVEYKVIIHDALIHNGSSGSMLINEDYEIVGLNTWGFVGENEYVITSEDYVIGGATPVNSIKDFLKDIKFDITNE